MKIKWKTLLLCIAIPLAVGGLSALVTMGSMETFEGLNQPPLSPPGWLFPVVWSVLFVLMGAASYLVAVNGRGGERIRALTLYGVQLVFNFLWSVFFFNCGWYLFSFFWLVALWALILWVFRLFHRVSSPAGWLLLPYLAWVAFAGYLNFGIYLLN